MDRMYFIRLHDRDGFDDPDWKAGYAFSSINYNLDEDKGLIYAQDEATGRIHDVNVLVHDVNVLDRYTGRIPWVTLPE